MQNTCHNDLSSNPLRFIEATIPHAFLQLGTLDGLPISSHIQML